MATFGLSTLPALLATQFGANWLNLLFSKRPQIKKFVAVTFVLIAILMVTEKMKSAHAHTPKSNEAAGEYCEGHHH